MEIEIYDQETVIRKLNEAYEKIKNENIKNKSKTCINTYTEYGVLLEYIEFFSLYLKKVKESVTSEYRHIETLKKI